MAPLFQPLLIGLNTTFKAGFQIVVAVAFRLFRVYRDVAVAEPVYESVEGFIRWTKSVTLVPKYDGLQLHNTLGDKRLTETLTNVIIPSFDIKLFQPIVFSSSKARRDDSEMLHYQMSASALLQHHISFPLTISKSTHPKTPRNSTSSMILLAISEVTKEGCLKSNEVSSLNTMDFDKFLILSLWTGSSERDEKLELEMEKDGDFSDGSWSLMEPTLCSMLS
ncbi:patatin-like protein 3 [Hibiscus syriacus]|uniref:patatin-like protein 3 n=1 Tax=Hibiscus syriacus TaxID=106335 RepID=UPI001923B383|nr:patatin-like protein 3 [Hibiscus syriacus]